MSNSATANAGSGPLGPIVQYFKDFGVLKDNPREYWAIQIVNFLDSAAYFSLISIATVYLTQNIGWGDVPTGYIVTVLTSLVTISLVFSGFFTDALGIRRSVILAISLQTLSRGGLLLFGLWEGAPFRMWLAVISLILTAPGLAMTITVFQSANKRFSTRRSRSASFNLWYLIMNLGGVAAGGVIDLVRLQLGIDNSYIFAFGAVAGVLSVATGIFLIRSEEQATDEEELEVVPSKPNPAEEGSAEERSAEEGPAGSSAEPPAEGGRRSAWELFKSVVRQSAFWRFIVLMVSVLGVRAAWTYMYLLMPKYWIRIIGEDVEMGFLQAINPTCVVIGLIIMIPIANKFNVFKMLVFGAFFSSLSLLVLVMPYEWFGSGIASGYFRMSVIMLVVLSFGEVIWSPKLNEYTAAIAPQGQEGSYLGMSMMPWFFAKTAVGVMSGHMLARWVPEGVDQEIEAGTLSFWESPEAMWLLLFFWAIVGPLLAIVFSGWLTKGADLDPGAARESSD